MKFKSEVQLEALNNATVDTDKFLVSDSSTVKYRTGAQVLSDIGGQAALTNPITGTGTTNYVSKFTSSSTLGNSLIYDNGTNVGIGTTSPNEKFTVNGKIYANPQYPVVISGAANPNWGTNLILSSDVGSTQGANRIWSKYDGTGYGALTFERATNSQSYGADPQVLTYAESMRIAGNGNVGIGTTNPYSLLQVGNYTGSGGYSFGTSGTFVSGWVSARPTLMLMSTDNTTTQDKGGSIGFGGGSESGSTPYTFAQIKGLKENAGASYNGYMAFYTTPAGSDANTERMRINSSGNIGIGTTGPIYKTDIAGNLRFSTGYLNSDNCFERVFSQAIAFPNGTANLAADVILGNISFWGYIEVEVTSTYSNQNSAGKLTKAFAVGTNPNNLIYTNESRIIDSMGTVPDNVAIGNMGWDSTNLRYRIPISHIVSTGNTYTVKVRMFTSEGSATSGARGVFNSISIGSNYTLTALARQYPYYNNRLGVGTSTPAYALDIIAESNRARIFATTGYTIFDAQNGGGSFYMGRDSSAGGSLITGSAAYSGVLALQGNYPLNFGTNGNIRATISGTGNFGIGTTGPAYKLDIVDGSALPTLRLSNPGGGGYGGGGNIIFEGGATDYVSGNISWKNGATTRASVNYAAATRIMTLTSENYIHFNIGGTNMVAVDTNGNLGVGLGGTYPATAHKIQANGRIATVTPYGDFTALETVSGNGFRWALSNNATFSLQKTTNGFASIAATPIVIHQSNNVGINHTAPSARLDVYKGSQSDTITRANASAYIYGADVGLAIGQGAANPWGTWLQSMRASDNVAFPLLLNPAGGNVGIGTLAPSYPLHVTTQVSSISIYANYDIVAYSDQSVKENVRPIENALGRVIESRGVLYDRIDSGDKNNIGFIAQELEVAFPELVVTNEDGTKAVKYQNAVAVLFEAIKEQQKQIDEIKTILNGLTN